MSGSVVLRLEPLAVAGADAALCRLAWLRLERTDAGIVLECAHDAEVEARALLSRCGIRARPDGPIVERPVGLVPAVATDLRPRTQAGIVDRLTVRAVDTPDAVARQMRRRPWPVRRDTERLHALLRGEDRLFAWRRVIWATRSVLRSPVRRGLRPIVFDRDAIERGEERWTSAAAGDLGRWLLG